MGWVGQESDILPVMLPMIAGYVMGSRAASRAAGMSVISDHMRGPGSVADIDSLNERVDRLLLVTEALWTLLKKDGHTTRNWPR